MHEGTVERVERIGHEAAIFWFSTAEKFEYVAGQFVQIQLEHDARDSRGNKRWFTLVSSPTEEFLGFCTKFPSSPSTFKQKLKRLQPGDKLKFSDAMGDFVLPRLESVPLVFISAGIGATPFRSILKWLIDRGEMREITLLNIARDEKNFLFRDLFHQADIQYLEFAGGRFKDKNDILAKVTKSAKEKYDTNKNTLIYIAGPENLVEEYRDALYQENINENNVLTDYFLGAER